MKLTGSINITLKVLIGVLLGIQAAYATSLTSEEFQRVKAVKQILHAVEQKPLDKIVQELERSDHPRTHLHMREAMAKTFADLVHEQDVRAQTKKEWLYSKISLNMAYLQFAGTNQQVKAGSELDKLILQKLKSYLPPNIDSFPGFHQSID